MARRLELQSELESLLGSRNVYFQPPESIKLKYPCFIYHLSNMRQRYADNKTYSNMDSYDLLYICDDPDDDMREVLLTSFEYIRFSRFYTADNLNHYAFTLFY